MLTKHGDSWFISMLEHSTRQGLSLSIRPRKKINVKFYSDYGGTDITVREFIDGELSYCNHAGARTEQEDFAVPQWDNDSHQFIPTGNETVTIQVCDKCKRWSENGEDWNE